MSTGFQDGRRRRGFFIVDNEVMFHYAPVIGPNPIAVYMCILSRVSFETRECTIRLKTIAEKTGTSVSTVQRSLRTLTGEDGVLDRHDLAPLLSVTSRTDADGLKVSSVYTVLDVTKSDPAEGGEVVTQTSGVVTETNPSGHTDQTDWSERPCNNNTSLSKTDIDQDTPHTPQRGSESASDDGVASTAPGKRSTLEERFARWYAHYPKKRHPAAARRAWDRIKPDDAMTERMIAAVERQKQSPEWLKQGGQFIPYPASWLNAGGWEDQLDIDLPTQEPEPETWNGKPLWRGLKYGFNPLTYHVGTSWHLSVEQVAAIEAGAKLKDVMTPEQLAGFKRAYANHCRMWEHPDSFA